VRFFFPLAFCVFPPAPPSHFHSLSPFHLLLTSILKFISSHSSPIINFTSPTFPPCLILSFTIPPLCLPFLLYFRPSLLS
jgi:hypothetical protein